MLVDACHVVGRLFDKEVAELTARQMEYPWDRNH